MASVPLQPQQPSHSSSVSTPVRSMPIPQVSTPSVATFQARANKAEVIVEHIGTKSNEKTAGEGKQMPSIVFKSLVKPYKYMYQTIYKRANGQWISLQSSDFVVVVSFLSLALNKQIEEFEDLFLTANNEKSNFVLYPIGNAVQVEFEKEISFNLSRFISRMKYHLLAESYAIQQVN